MKLAIKLVHDHDIRYTTDDIIGTRINKNPSNFQMSVVLQPTITYARSLCCHKKWFPPPQPFKSLKSSEVEIILVGLAGRSLLP